jgi:SAM-dependent methyltransferase
VERAPAGPDQPGGSLVGSLAVRGTILARRGDPRARHDLDLAADRGYAADEMQFVAPAAIARAEYFWLAGDVDPGAAEAKFAALAAARCRCEVVAIDYVPELMDRGRARAEAEHLSVKFRVADAEALPCDDGEYDAVLSVVGVMFAPNQEAAAGEIVRVCRPGGTIALASWTPDGFIGRLLKTVSRHVPPPPGVRPPVQWGAEERPRELFGDRITDLRTTRRDFVFRFTSAEDLADYFRANYGPTLKAFEAVGADGAKALHEDLVELANQHSSADDGTLKIRSGYLQALAYRA